MGSSPSPPKVKSPLPMVPVPQALESVLTETAKSLWFSRERDGGSDSPVPFSSTPSSPLSSHEILIGRTSAADVEAPSPGYPDHNASIMDGYAVKTSDLVDAKRAYDAMDSEQRKKYALEFVIVGKVYAGDDDEEGESHPNNAADSGNRTAVYVTTGAVMPADYDAVVPIEETAISPSNDGDGEMHRMRIVPYKLESVLEYKPWKWVRPTGCDIPSGFVVLSRGERIRPVHMALLAQVGVSPDEVRVKRLPRVGVVSTGNEVLAPSGERARGKIPDANRPLLLSQLSAYGNCVPVDLGIVTDDEGCENIARRLGDALWGADGEHEGVDVLVTTGGISMGEKDVMERVFVEGMGGEVHFGRMNMKPGKPTTFVTINGEDAEEGGRCQKLVFALPGNPVSASVCTELLVRPCLDLLHDGVDAAIWERSPSLESFAKHAAGDARVHEEVMATITSDVRLDQGRPEYRRVALRRASCADTNKPQQYTYHATGTGVQRSSRVLSLRGADGLMMLPRGGPLGCGYDVARKGMEFPVLLYTSLSFTSGNRFRDSMHRGVWKSKREHSHHAKGRNLALGIIICVSDRQENDSDFRSIDATLVNSLGGDGQVSIVERFICKVPSNSENDALAERLSTVVGGPRMEGANVIFAVVPTDPLAEERGAGAIAFRAGLEVSHALRPVLTKNASALALQLRKRASLRDPAAALFENVVGVVRGGSAVLITCSDRGLDGAAGAVKGLLGHLTSLLVQRH